MEEQLQQAEPQVQVEVVDIRFRPGQKVYFFDPAGLHLHVGDHVIIDTARGAEFGECTAANHPIAQKDVVTPLRRVIRMANAQDERLVAENRAREKRAFELCTRKIEELGLDMQLVSCECSFDNSRILFFFTADERVDFRELVKLLAANFHTRIELRQIGVRDKARMVGGLGICGRPFCCTEFLDDFQPVSIKMAKTQSLSLNPTKISGVCGRLMCCLKYEQDAYEDLLRHSPKEESFVDTPEGRGTVVEQILLRRQVRVRMEREPEVTHVFSLDDIAVFRNGKARKGDDPIPQDWAPISGSGAPARRVEPDAPIFLDPIRLRYSDESLTDEPARTPTPAPQESEPEQKPASRRRNKGKNRAAKPEQQPTPQPASAKKKPAKTDKVGKSDKSNKPEKQKPPRAEKSAAQAPADGSPAGSSAEKAASGKPAGRRHYYHRRPRKPSDPT